MRTQRKGPAVARRIWRARFEHGIRPRGSAAQTKVATNAAYVGSCPPGIEINNERRVPRLGAYPLERGNCVEDSTAGADVVKKE